MTDSTQNDPAQTEPTAADIIAAITEHEGVDEKEAAHRLLERCGLPRLADVSTGSARIQALRTAAELMQQDADYGLVPVEGQDPETVMTADLEYLGPYAISVLFTQIADHADQMPTPVLAWAIVAAEAIVESEWQDNPRCRFCRCTEDRPCPGGCGWATDEQLRAAGLEPMDGDVCTTCSTKAEAGILVTAS